MTSKQKEKICFDLGNSKYLISYIILIPILYSVMSKEAQLFQVPENINVKSNIMKSEEMLSSQMLSGIPEVDLGA